MTSVLIQGEDLDTETDTRREDDMKRSRETVVCSNGSIGAMLPQTKGHLGLPGSGRGKEGCSPCITQRDHGPIDTLTSDL